MLLCLGLTDNKRQYLLERLALEVPLIGKGRRGQLDVLAAAGREVVKAVRQTHLSCLKC